MNKIPELPYSGCLHFHVGDLITVISRRKAEYFDVLVCVQLSEGANSEIQIDIIDDGSGLSQEEISQFGARRSKRTIDKKAQGRLSLGLGSVIMRAIALLHRGRVEMGNILDPVGKMSGARLVIRLPRN